MPALTVTLRQIEEEDLRQMRDWRNEPRIRRMCREYRLLNMADQKAWFDGLRGDTTRLMFAIEAQEHFVGVCGWTHIDWRSGHALLSLYIGHEDYQRDGWYLAVLRKLHCVAFDDLGMRTVRAEIYAFDSRQALVKNAGYREAGRWREGHLHEGDSHNILLFDITAEEWFRELTNGSRLSD